MQPNEYDGIVDNLYYVYRPLLRLADVVDWRRLRVGRNLSLRATSARAGVSAAHLSRIERGLRRPSDAVAGRLADELALGELLAAEAKRVLRSQKPEQGLSDHSARADHDHRGRRSRGQSTVSGEALPSAPGLRRDR